MAHRVNPKISVSEEILSTYDYDKELLENKLSSDLQMSHEIFRNNTTAVEVIVKEIKHKGEKKIVAYGQKTNTGINTTDTSNGDVEKLSRELHEANSKLDEQRRCFKVILCEMKKQLEGANQRELKTQTRNLALRLEKEKLKTLLESKTNLVKRLKKELMGMRRMLKAVLKGIRFNVACSGISYNFDTEYEEFERVLIDNAVIVAPGNSFDEHSAIENVTSSKTCE